MWLLIFIAGGGTFSFSTLDKLPSYMSCMATGYHIQNSILPDVRTSYKQFYCIQEVK